MRYLVILVLFTIHLEVNAQRRAKITYVLCDLTLESNDQIDGLIRKVEEILKNALPNNKVVIAYSFNNRFEKILTLPYVNTRNIEGTILKRKRRQNKINQDVNNRKEVALSARDLIENVYMSKFERDRRTPRSCLMNFVNMAVNNIQMIGKGSSNRSHEREIIFISDLEINCLNSFCKNSIIMTNSSFDQILERVSNCRLTTSTSLISKFTFMPLSNSNSLPLQRLEDLWRQFLVRSGMEIEKVFFEY